MVRPQRLSLSGQAHHLVQTGHNKQPVFLGDEDRLHYLACLQACAVECRVRVHAHALMPDHVHLLLSPSDATGISRLMQSLGRRYVVWFNQRHGRSGTIWEGRFKLCLVEGDVHYLRSQRFIELNPLRVGLVSDLLGYPWTSAAHHLGQRVDAGLVAHPCYWQLGNTPFERQANYRRFLDDGVAAAEAEQIRWALQRGVPYAGPAFIAQVEASLGRAVMPKPRGRPVKRAEPALDSGTI